MSYFFDTKAKAFLVEGIHEIPNTAIKIDDEDYQILLDGRAEGKQIFIDSKGKLQLTPTAKPSEHHQWNGKAWEISESGLQAVKETQKSAKREEINRKRDEVCFGGIYIESLGKWFDTDETSFVKMIGAKAVMDDDFANGQEIQPELWICADNSVVQLGRDDLALIIRSIKQNVSNMHAIAVQHKMQLEQSDNPSEYDFSAGWSKTYQDFLAEQDNG